MSYLVQFYSIAEDLPVVPDHDPDSVATFIESYGRSVGELEFRAGKSTLFFQAVEMVLSTPALALFISPQFGVEPDEEDPVYGGLSRTDAEQLISRIDSILDNSMLSSPARQFVVDTARKLSFDSEEFFVYLSQLKDLLAECLHGGGRPVTLYS